MKRILTLMICSMAAVALLASCSGDETLGPETGDPGAKDLVRGQIATGTEGFEYTAETDDGALRIVGSNLMYDEDDEILGVDIVLVNETSVDLEGPVRLHFLQVMPDGVTVLNADHPDSATATGAEFAFAFADTDTVWQAGAATASRSVHFGVAPGVSIAFTSRILVGDEPVGGAIGGRVWHDMNENGVLDEDEMGAPDVAVTLHTGAKADDDSMMMHATTDDDGYYDFAGLGAGHYTVALAEDESIMPTTESSMEVLLVEHDGQVGDFLQADFGVVRTLDDMLSCLEVGAYLNAKGWAIDDSTGGLMAEIANVYDNESDCEDDWDGDSGEDSGDDCEDCGDEDGDKHGWGRCWGRLAGPITDIDREAGAFAVMGTWVHLPPMEWDKDDDGDDDIRTGLRVRVNAHVVETDDGPRVEACRVHFWNGYRDRVRGPIQEVVSDDDGPIGVIVLNTYVALPGDFTCDDLDDDDDQDDQDDGNGESDS